MWKKQVKKTWLPFLYGMHSDVSVLISLAWSILFFKHSGYDLASDVSILQWVRIPVLRNPVANAASLWLRYLLVCRWRQPHSQRPCWQTAVCGREPRMVGGISIKLRKRIPCSFRELKEMCSAAEFWLSQEQNTIAWLTAPELSHWNGRRLTLWS